jgi:cytosine/adenosine deaminase-related metal-dependent hydrolase
VRFRVAAQPNEGYSAQRRGRESTTGLLVRNARPYPTTAPVDGASGGLVDLLTDGERIARMVPAGTTIAGDHQELDAAGRFLSPPLVDPHVHLDAVLTVGEPRYNESGTLIEGILTWAERKPSLTH